MIDIATPQATPAEIVEKLARPFPRIWASVGWIAFYFVLQFIIGSIAGVIALTSHAAPNASVADIAASATDLKIIAVATIWSLVISSMFTLSGLYFYLRKERRTSAIWLDRWSQMNVTRTLLWAVGLLTVGIGCNYLIETYLFPGIEMQKELREIFAAIPKTIPNQLLLFAAAVILVPILEELLFRGLLQKSLTNRLPVWAAISMSSAVFALLHVEPNGVAFGAYAMPGIFLLGSIFGFLYQKTGSLRTNILLHMINNGAALLLSWFFPG